jgi:ADP-ribose pyrophosphatase YjhB (NUDIX family)
MSRREYYHEPGIPQANSLAPTAFAAVRDKQGRVLLVRRVDSGNQELPGGRVEFGESASVAVEREVHEESGVTITVSRLAGLYSDPDHVMVYPDTGEVRQQFAVCVHAKPVGGTPRADHDETCQAGWIDPAELPYLPIHPSMRQRIHDALACPDAPHLG